MVNAFSCALVDGVLAALENTTALSIFLTIIYFLNNPLWCLTFSGVHIIIYHLPIELCHVAFHFFFPSGVEDSTT